MAKKKKPLSPPAKLALAKAEHARAKKALDKAADKLDQCKICNEDKLESEVEKLAKRHGVAAVNLKRAIRGEPTAPKKAAKKRTSKKRASKKAAAPAAAPAPPKKASKKKSAKKKPAKKASSKTAKKKSSKKRGKKAAKKASKK
jgi:hypothetical protein